MANYLELERIKKKHSGEVCIFGAGLIGRNEAYELLTLAGYKIDFFCDNNIPEGTHIRDDIYIKELQYLYDNKDKILVFLCVSPKYQKDLLTQLVSHGIEDVIIVDRSYISQILDSIEKAPNSIKEQYFSLYDDKEYLKSVFKRRMGYELNLDNPKTFNEKLQWLKLYDRKPEYISLVDKYEFKQYIKEILGEEYIIPTIGVWDLVEEIDWDGLPDQFVIKCTHDSGSVMICRDKKNFNIVNAKEKLCLFMKRMFFWSWREWPYKAVKPRIIAEKYMQDAENKELRDYKFYCFNGKPRFLYVSEGLENFETARISYIKVEEGKWEFAPFRRTDFGEFKELPERPNTYIQMVEIVEKLSKNYSFVRVDLYEINGRIYVSEMTFTPGAGFTKIVPEEWDEILGSYIQL